MSDLDNDIQNPRDPEAPEPVAAGPAAAPEPVVQAAPEPLVAPTPEPEPVPPPAETAPTAAEPEPRPRAEARADARPAGGQRPPKEKGDRGPRPPREGGREQGREGARQGGGGSDRRGPRPGGPGGDRRDQKGGRPEIGFDIDLDKLMSDSLYLDNQAHAVVSRMRDMDSGTRSQLRRLYSAIRRACRAAEADRQHQFVMLRARLAYTIARHQLRSLDGLEKLLLQVTRKNDARGYERFRDLFEAIVAYNE